MQPLDIDPISLNFRLDPPYNPPQSHISFMAHTVNFITNSSVLSRNCLNINLLMSIINVLVVELSLNFCLCQVLLTLVITKNSIEYNNTTDPNNILQEPYQNELRTWGSNLSIHAVSWLQKRKQNAYI